MRQRTCVLSKDDESNLRIMYEIYELCKNNIGSSEPREDSDRPGHLPSPIRVFAVGMKVA